MLSCMHGSTVIMSHACDLSMQSLRTSSFANYGLLLLGSCSIGLDGVRNDLAGLVAKCQRTIIYNNIVHCFIQMPCTKLCLHLLAIVDQKSCERNLKTVVRSHAIFH